MNKTALIFGVSGQDGPYLARLLLDEGYKVIGVMRRISHPNMDFISDFQLQEVELVEGDLSDAASINNIILAHRPDEVYNLASQSHVGTSFKQPELTSDINAMGVLRILEAIRLHSPRTKFYQAGSTDMFHGNEADGPKNEESEMKPLSPYAAAKIFAYNIISIYRNVYGIYACCGICTNHESPRRGIRFVTKKITDYIGRYANNLEVESLKLGFIDSMRDWTFAGDVVESMYKMMQLPNPTDFVIGSGVAYSVREFIEIAFKEAGYTIQWRGNGVHEKGYWTDTHDGIHIVVEIDKEFYRPHEVPAFVCDPSKANQLLKWRPRTSFKDLVKMMVQSDIKKYRGENHVVSTY